MKKIIALSLALLMVLGMVACGNQTAENDATDESTGVVTESNANRFTVCPLWPLGNSPIFNSC